jgi:hypothetical protein
MLVGVILVVVGIEANGVSPFAHGSTFQILIINTWVYILYTVQYLTSGLMKNAGSGS